MNISRIQPDGQTVVVEGQAYGEQPVDVTPEGIQAAQLEGKTGHDLEPCPFCGGKAEYYYDCDMVKVRCSNSVCQCELVTWFDEPEEAAEEWNRRAV